jgi:hypothetical protein
LDYDLAQVKAVYILQGRYYVTPIVSQMVCLCVGIIVSAPRRLRAAVAQALGVGMVALNGYVLLGPLMQRYYGAGALVGQLERAARLHPVGSGPSLVACVLLAFLSALLLPTLWSKADWIEDLPVVMHH